MKTSPNTDNQNDISNTPASALDIETITEKSIVRLSTENGVKYIKFLGYGYRTDENDDKPYRFVEYCFFEVPIRTVLPDIYGYENEESSDYKQYISECTAEEMFKTYCEYDNGKAPILININSIDENTPDGCYILLLSSTIERIMQNERNNHAN